MKPWSLAAIPRNMPVCSTALVATGLLIVLAEKWLPDFSEKPVKVVSKESNEKFAVPGNIHPRYGLCCHTGDRVHPDVGIAVQ